MNKYLIVKSIGTRNSKNAFFLMNSMNIRVQGVNNHGYL